MCLVTGYWLLAWTMNALVLSVKDAGNETVECQAPSEGARNSAGFTVCMETVEDPPNGNKSHTTNSG